jgi:hypothetical protein
MFGDLLVMVVAVVVVQLFGSLKHVWRLIRDDDDDCPVRHFMF